MASIKCGKCKETHTSVGEVRVCYMSASIKAAQPAKLTVGAPNCSVVSASPAYYSKVNTVSTLPAVEVPESHYALINPNSNEVEFFEVKKAKGKSYTYVRRLVGGPGDWMRYPLRYAEANKIKSRIAADTFTDKDDLFETKILTGPQAAAVRYSREFVRCACCSAPLSDPVSRAQGLGPVCIERFA